MVTQIIKPINNCFYTQIKDILDWFSQRRTYENRSKSLLFRSLQRFRASLSQKNGSKDLWFRMMLENSFPLFILSNNPKPDTHQPLHAVWTKRDEWNIVHTTIQMMTIN